MIIITMIIKIIVRIIVLLFGYLCFFYFFGFISEAATRIALCKKVFLEISQNLQENTCARVSFLIQLQALGLQLY